jgi:hypothetical protein
MDESLEPSVPGGGVEIKSTVLFGPLPVPNGDDDLLPLAAALIATISSAASNLVQHAVGATDERGAARRLCSLAALGACGELRALILLCTSGLSMLGRIHLRSIDEAMKRTVVYFNDQTFALETERALADFRAEGLAKIDETDRARFTARDEETADRFEQLMQSAKPPLLITKNPAYRRETIASLDPFRHWFYSQVEHYTPIALAEISNCLSLYSEQIYNTSDGVQLLVTAIGMGLNIAAHLAALGVDMRDHFDVLKGRFEGVLERSGLAGPPDGLVAEGQPEGSP